MGRLDDPDHAAPAGKNHILVPIVPGFQSFLVFRKLRALPLELLESLELLELGLFKDLRKLRFHLGPVIFWYFDNLGKFTLELAIIRLARVDQDAVIEVPR